jgi:hypothetical protein
MKKIIIQGAITILLFFGTWFALAQIDWIKVFKVQMVTDKTEQKLGEPFWKIIKTTEKENKNFHLVNAIESIVTQVCKTDLKEKQ